MGSKSRKPGTAASYAVLLPACARSHAPTHAREDAWRPDARRVGVGVPIPSRSTLCVERPARNMIIRSFGRPAALSLLEHLRSHMLRETGQHAPR
jgi:hypothetical protein